MKTKLSLLLLLSLLLSLRSPAAIVPHRDNWATTNPPALVTSNANWLATNVTVAFTVPTSNGLSDRLLGTNTAIRADLATQMTDTNTALRAVINTTSNVISDRLLGTNTAIRTDLATQMADTNTALRGVINTASNTVRAAVPDINATNGIGFGSKIFNVKGFGALGDGTTDDTDACNAAVAAAKAAAPATVYFPSGRYRLRKNTANTYNGCIQMNDGNGVTFLGDGPGQTVLLNRDTVNNGVSVLYIIYGNRNRVIGMTIDGGAAENGFSPSANENEGLNFGFQTNGLIRDVVVTNVLADGFDLDWNHHGRYENLKAFSCANSGFKINGQFNQVNGFLAVNCGYTGTDFDKGGFVMMDCYETTAAQISTTNCWVGVMVNAARQSSIRDLITWTDGNTRTNMFWMGGENFKLIGASFNGGNLGIYLTNSVQNGSIIFPVIHNVTARTHFGLWLHTGVTMRDAIVENFVHTYLENPFGSGSGRAFELVGTVERCQFRGGNLRSGSSNARIYGAFHNNTIQGITFGTWTGTAWYYISGTATNNLMTGCTFTEAGAAGLTMDGSGPQFNLYLNNVSKGVWNIRGGTNYFANNWLKSGITLNDANARSNRFNGNVIEGSFVYAGTGAQTDADQIWGINFGPDVEDTNP